MEARPGAQEPQTFVGLVIEVMSTYNQGNPTISQVISSSNVFIYGNTSSGNALSVQQLGAGNVAAFKTSAGSTALFVGANGNVGVGTATPLAPLSTYFANSGIPDTTGSGTSNVATRFQVGSVCLDMGNITNGNMWLQNHLNTNWATNYPLLLNPNGGNVGVGTTSPNWTLSTQYAGNNDTGTTPVLNFAAEICNSIASGNNNRTNLLLFTDNNSTQGAIGAYRRTYNADYTGGLVFYVGSQPSGYNAARPTTTTQASASLTEAMRITPGGNVGIGTTNPSSYTLQVVGTIGATGDITAYYSDERLKTKTGLIESALEKVLSLEAFTYVPNDLAKSFGFEDSKQRVGLSAQSVQRILPEAVCPAPFDADNASGQQYLTVQYDKLVPLLVEAIKELAGR
jgi:hypothetical protein